MKILKNTLIVSSYVLLVALFFTGGYAIGKIGVEKETPAAPQITPEAVAAAAEKTAEGPEYEVVIEDGGLKIYKCIGDIKTIVMSEEISEAVFPPDDVRDLREGVRFERLEQAQQMFENFVS